MTQKNETPLLIASLLFTAGIVGAGYWFFVGSKNGDRVVDNTTTPTTTPATPTTTADSPTPPTTTAPTSSSSFPLPTTVAVGTTVKIDGSTSMVGINQTLKQRFQSKFPNTIVQTNAQGSSKGLSLLLSGKVDVAAISRPLTNVEQKSGLVSIPISKDFIALIVGEKNPFRKSLSQKQIVGIFTGVIKNWSAVGGSSSSPIQVYNRPPESGTRSSFQEIVLSGSNFGTTPNIITMPRDATTPIIQKLGTDGISYATYTQAATQKTARIVPIDNLSPQDANYPLVRFLYYVYKTPASEPAKAFLGYITSPEGQKIIQDFSAAAEPASK